MRNDNHLVKSKALPNIPWEDRPSDCSDVVWRSERNPIIPRDYDVAKTVC